MASNAASNDSTKAQNDDELFDVVDVNDRVIGQATRAKVHANDLFHRAVHIWVFRPDGRLLLQMRSAQKDQYPSTWTSSASGHVDAGEEYFASATRELSEELGLHAPLTRITKLTAGPETAFEFTELFATSTETEPRPNPAEIAGLKWWPPADALQELHKHPERFSPPLRMLLQWWEGQNFRPLTD